MRDEWLQALLIVATLLQIICVFVVPWYCDALIRKHIGKPDKSKLVGRAKLGKEINMWVLMANMIIKVAIENRLSWPSIKFGIWILDMLLMILVAAILVKKYIFQRRSKG